ncbi:MAG: hypothetical protein RMK29_20060 [Myxococcales bacterium]|nr:hypothetical protein [Myxococcota bacterium]MDW8284005.1 hypothetical protein [Myxococcales bacterium]
MRAGLAVVLWGLLASWTHAAELTLALYAPTAPLPSAQARFAYIEGLARQLRAAGLEVQGRAFARAADLEAAIRRGQVDLAVLDAIYLAERGTSYPVLAIATVGSETVLRWGLYTSLSAPGVLDLAGTRLAWTQVASREPVYLDNVLFDGELRVAQHFDLRPPAPDVAAAVSEVVLRRADCVLAPDAVAAGKGLRRVFDAGRLPNPALVQVQPRLGRDLIQQVQRTVLSTATVGGLDGWRASGNEPFRQLRQRLMARSSARRFVLAEPQPLLGAVRSEVIALDEIQPALPPLRSLLLAP